MRFKSKLRYELKYLISHAQKTAMIDALLDADMSRDSHGDTDGQYPITSVYYDTADHKAFWDKLEGHRNRRKVRVRVYGAQEVTPQTVCFLEIKHRLNKRMAKKRVALPHFQAVNLHELDALSLEFDEPERSVLREVHYLYRTLHLQPTCVVSYDRLAFNGVEPYTDLRVTFDTELKGRVHDLSLLSTGQTQNVYFLPPEFCIMEVKVNQNVPYWLAQTIAEQACTFRRISKYCSALERDTSIRQRQRIIAQY